MSKVDPAYALPKLKSVPTEIVNFHLGPDFALGVWEANNYLFKPESFRNQGAFYEYSPDNVPQTKLEYWNALQQARTIISVPEAMGYVTRSRSRARGAHSEIGNRVVTSVNMGVGSYGFGNEHSAQWEFTIQKAYPFWRRLGIELNFDVTNR